MKRIKIDSFADFHHLVGGQEANNRIFRGVTDVENHKLIAGVGRLTREQRGQLGLGSYERRIINLFKKSALPYLKALPKSELEWLAIAQHHGLPTRLLDWSYNPLVALFFACSRDSTSEHGVYCYKARSKTIGTLDGIDPFEIKTVLKFSPDHSSERIASQMGLFTVHPAPRLELKDPDRLELIVFSSEFAHSARYTL